ncbi:hypothetical protein ACFLS9_02595 [Bacteroidota bacterium]
MKQKGTLIFFCFLTIAFLLTSCAPGNEKFIVESAGFWSGLWHGLISLVTFIISIFNDSVRMYEVHNTGILYDLGFILGAGFFFTNIGQSTKSRKKGN